MHSKVKRELNFHFPVPSINFGRKLSTFYRDGNLWTAVQMEKGRKTNVGVYRNGKFIGKIETDGFVHQPSICSASEGYIFISWNEVMGEKWLIKGAIVKEKDGKIEGIENIFENEKLVLPPDITLFQNKLWCVFPAIREGKIKIHLMEREDGGWKIKEIISGNSDAFRVKVNSDGNFLYCVYDQYKNKTYEIICEIFNGKRWKKFKLAPPSGERWFDPKIISSKKGVYIIWVSLKEVEDKKLGIRDHFPFAMAGRIKDNKVEYLYDKTHPEDKRIIIDLREGLLASEIYQGYHGLRRNPYISISDRGELWCFWEVKIEREGTNISGHLFGRKLREDNTWSPYYDLYKGKYSYSVPSFFEENKLPVSFISIFESKENVVGSDWINLKGKKKIYTLNPEKWKRWKAVRESRVKKKERKIYLNGKEYKIFWADTHCHSNNCPDAEGEVDELIHYARDIAGIDVVCIMDNDYYPRKSLTESEWQVQNQLSQHFTQKGKFVVFTGWEFTYHRKDLQPTYNHRCIIYPFSGGKLYRRIDDETNTDEKLMEKLKNKRVICYPHHCTYKIINPRIDKNVEVCSSWRVCIEEIDFTVEQLKKGEVFGFIGSSDTHRSVPGLGGALTGVIAEELTPESLYEAYRKRRLIATQGCRLKIDFRISDLFIGEEGKIKGIPEITGKVIAEKKIDFLEVVRDGEIIFKEKGKTKKMSFKFMDRKAEKGRHFYFLRVKLIGNSSFHLPRGTSELKPHVRESKYPHNLARAIGVYAWTSPIWLTII
ncbi:hypothetical protein J7L87_01380 [bacterium]|nr:hypothetical protein [bacterium]